MSVISRRAFVGAMSLAPLAAVPPKPRMYTWLACATLGVKANQREAIELAHRHGFESVEPLAEELAAMSADDLKRVADDVKSKNLRWGTATMRLNFNVDDTAFASGMKALPKLAKAMQTVGATRIYKFVNPASDSLTYMQNFKRHVRNIAAVAGVMEDHGLRLGLEYSGPKTAWAAQHFPFVHTMAEARELIAATGKQNIGLDIDTFHWYTAHETVADLLALTNRDVVTVDACDAPPGTPIDERLKENRELPCTSGTIDLAGVMNALNQIGYDGPVRADPLFRAAKGSKDEAVAAAAQSIQRLFALIR
jgi:sugar phosphate isomerase/epimerase